MFKEEIIELLNLIKNTEGKEQETIIASNFEILSASFYALKLTERKELIESYSGILYDLGLITSKYLSDEERLKRRNRAMNKPKFNETEEKIRQIFINIFGEEPYWLKSKKSFSQFRNKGINIMLPHWDSNLGSGYLDGKPKGYSICLGTGFPYFYIYIGEDEEDIFLYIEKKEETDLESIELNQKGINFLIEIQRTFASRTPDSIYVSSYYNDEDSRLAWMVTSRDCERLVYSTERITSGVSNIVSLSAEAYQSKLIYPVSTLKEQVENRIIENGNPITIAMLNELRTSFDNVFNKEINPKRARVNPESEEE